MSNLLLRVELDNDAFAHDLSDLARILREVADYVERCDRDAVDGEVLYLSDVNGNNVGDATFEIDSEVFSDTEAEREHQHELMCEYLDTLDHATKQALYREFLQDGDWSSTSKRALLARRLVEYGHDVDSVKSYLCN